MPWPVWQQRIMLWISGRNTGRRETGSRIFWRFAAILPFRLSEQDGKIILRLTAGSVENIKPEFLMDAFFKSQGKELSPYALQLHRLDLLANDETDENLPPRFRSLEDYGTDIL